jgi:Uma2 family endonuclease
MTVHTAITAEELLKMGDIGRCELIRGEIVKMAAAGAEHGHIALDVSLYVGMHVKANRLGHVYAAETGFIIARNPDTVRAPDVGFVRKDRLLPSRLRGYFPGAPDLAIEVISFNDRRPQVATKVAEWLAAGTISVWVIDPPKRSITVYRTGDQVLRYAGEQELRDEPTLPGFVLKLSELFDPES